MNLDSAAWTAYWTLALVVVTCLLVVGAFKAATYARKTWEVAQEELDIAKTELSIAREVEVRREAAGVASWLSLNLNYQSLLGITVENTNPLPVFDVVVRVLAVDKGGACKSIWDTTMGGAVPLAILPKGKHKVWDLDGANYVNGATIQGGTVTKNGPVRDWGSWQVWTGKSGEPGIAVEMSFRDSSGIYWNRGITGQLTRQE